LFPCDAARHEADPIETEEESGSARGPNLARRFDPQQIAERKRPD